MFYKYMVFINKESREVELVIEKDLLNTKLDIITKNLKDWDWFSVDSVDEIDKII